MNRPRPCTPRTLSTSLPAFLLAVLLTPLLSWAPAQAQTTAADPATHAGAELVDADELAMQIKHLTAEELEAEAQQWRDRLRAIIEQLNEARIAVSREAEALEDIRASEGERPEDSEPSPEEAAEQAVKDQALERMLGLEEERARYIKRLNVVLDEWSAKLGKTAEGTERDAILEYRLYIRAVDDVKVDASDTHAVIATFQTWLKSPEGGVRLLMQVLSFIASVLAFWLLGWLLSRLAARALRLANSASQILKDFIVKTIVRVMIIIGVIVGLSTTDIDITPMLAVIGAAGFVIAFALQGTLSNFASGLMIMFYKPFDVDDVIETPNVFGKVRSMTLVTTNVLTPDNKLVVVPNNELWGNVITNITGSHQRRVDLLFGIAYDDDMALAERVLTEIVSGHPKVLEDPAPVVRVHELGDSSVNLVCRPWVKTEDYWEVYWDVTRQAKERFDAVGLSIPFPQRDVHLFTAPPAPGAGDGD